MGVDTVRYRRWTGRRRGAFAATAAISRCGVRLLFRRKLFYVFLVLGLTNYLLHAALVYFRTEFFLRVQSPENSFPVVRRLAPAVQDMIFTGNGDSYKDFIFIQSIPVMLVLAYAGVVWLAADHRLNALAFYLARPIHRGHLLVGKLMPLVILGSLLTLVPALALFIQYGAFTTSIEYWLENHRILWAILASGALISITTAVYLVGIAARFRRPASLLVVWGGLFVFLPGVSGLLRRHFERQWSYEEAWYFGLLNIWKNLEWSCKGLFSIQPERYTERMIWSLAVLALLALLSLLSYFRHVHPAGEADS